MKRSGTIIVLVIILVLQMVTLSGCPDIASDTSGTVVQTVPSQAMAFTTLVTPFNGDGDWYLTQAFSSYFPEMEGHHTGEDWNLAGDNSGKCAVYSIAPGEVVGSGLISASLGYYMIIQHTGNFKIPASNNGHLNSLIDLKLESPIYAKYLFSEGKLLSSELGNKFLAQGTDDKDAYSYPETTVSTIYSVYLHINNPKDFIKTLGESKYITQEILDNPIATLAAGLSFSSHLHFEIRVGEKDDILGSTISGTTNGNGYSDYSQKMVDAGYREPSSIIQANGGQGSITGDVLGEIEGIDISQSDLQQLSLAKTTAGFGKLVEQDGDWIYFSLEGIYRVKADGTELSKISDAYADYICLSDGWIYGSVSYYEFDDGFYIWKMRTDGTEYVKIAEYGNGAAYSFQIDGDWLYLCSPCEIAAEVIPESAYGTGGVYRIKTDGSDLTKIIDGDIWYILITNNTIYYEDGYPSEDLTSNSFYKAETNGSSNIQITTEEWLEITSSIPTDFTDSELYNDDFWICEAQSNGNCIYYFVSSFAMFDNTDGLLSDYGLRQGFWYYERKLYRINVDGTSRQEIFSGYSVVAG